MIVLFLMACTGKPDSTADSPADSPDLTETTSEPFECPTPEIHVSGNDPPVVGDEWDIFLWCGSVLMTGATIINLDPSTLADVDAPHLVWINAGTGTLTLQVGFYEAERAVEVGP